MRERLCRGLPSLVFMALLTACGGGGSASGTGDQPLITPGVAYSASGGGTNRGGTIVVTGVIEDLTRPFTLTGTFTGGGVVTFRYTPTSPSEATSGTVRLTGSAVGEGTYTIATAPGAPAGSLMLTASLNSCVPGGGCSATTEYITLTPL